MPSTRTRPTRDQTRAKILEAAAAVFTTKGYDGASLDQVARAAGLTKGAVYSSFAGGKDELFFALIDSRLDQQLDVVGAHADGQSDIQALFAAAEQELAALRTSQADWHLLFIESWARAVRDPARREQWAAKRRTVRGVIAAWFTRHAEATGSTLALPAEDLALVSMALSNGLAMEHLADPDSADPGLFARTLGRLAA